MKKKIALFLVIVLTVNAVVLTGCGKIDTGWPKGGKTGFIQVEGGRVLYHLYGENKEGIPIIFLHGGPGDDCAYFFQQVVLAENHPVVMYNQLGSDGSDYTKGTTLNQAQELMTIDHYVNELQSVVDYFNFEEFMLVGCSWGSMLAVEYASEKQPEGLKGIVANGPFLSTDVWCAEQERLIKSLPSQDVCGEMMDGNRMWEVILECEEAQTYYDDERYTRIDDIYCDNFNRRPENDAYVGTKPSDADFTEYVIDGLSVYDYMWGPSEFSCLGTLQGHDSTPLLKDIQVPILYLCGEYDAGTPESAYLYKSMSNNAEVIVIDGCAHSSARERSTEFNAIIEEFATRISSCDVYNLVSDGTLHILNNFKVYNQTTDYTCGPSCLYMVLDYFDILGNKTEMSLAEKSGTTPDSGSLIYPMADAIIDDVSNIEVMKRKFSDSSAFSAYVRVIIDENAPMIICKDHHYRCIIGIDTEKELLYFADSRDNKDGIVDGYNIENLDDFFDDWNPIYMVIYK